ncbi:hypothetical protein GP486_001227 [Trichoglossum hirsutum]|uniref:NodB homology domain-containing protein n=1 Tax=Trichoglossum hirsutum TaxID=265104 RepID=A0A9P8RST5_9PEZI|nr:hypothetical protein GP486_001227 [Trichoglossum hirsutum]
MQVLPLLLSALSAVAAAHPGGIPGAPKLVGGRGLAMDLRARAILAGPAVREKRPSAEQELKSRQIGGSGLALLDTVVLPQDGAVTLRCVLNLYCTANGLVSNSIQKDYCAAPDCQYDYGPGCDTNIPPPGASTSTIARPHIGSIPYGGGGVQFGGIYDCLQNGAIALTFDDGPYLYTSHILDVLASYNAKATFFITGNNLGKGRIDDPATGYPAIIQRMVREGHQIASHTWGHQNLSSMTTTKMKQQMYYNEMAFRNILGYFPTYMRPPFSQCSLACESMLDSLGYHITYFDLDTQDYLNDSPTLIQNSKTIFNNALQGANPTISDFLVIGHDIHEQTAYNLTDYALSRMQALGFGTSVTVGQCLGDPIENWYRSAGSAVPSSPPSSTSKSSTSTGAIATGTSKKITSDATCGGSNGYTCQGSTFGGSSPFLSILTAAL